MVKFLRLVPVMLKSAKAIWRVEERRGEEGRGGERRGEEQRFSIEIITVDC
jgi:hypothetical protein